MVVVARFAVAGLLFCLGSLAMAQDSGPPAGFLNWLELVKRDALSAGVRPRTLETALASLAPIARVVELDRAQPEARLSFAEYLSRTVNEARVQRGRQRLAEQQALLEGLQQRYRVPPGILVSLWAMETDFGRFGGNFPVLGALATLAYEGRRAETFRKELIEALLILDEDRIAPAQLKGSWAGAMGQVQFMPSTYRRFAVDWDGDGRRDIWSSTGDALASAANYLSQSGWNGNEPWGQELVLPPGFDATLAGRDKRRRAEEWRRFGVAPMGRPDFVLDSFAVVLPDGPEGRAFAVARNVDMLMLWNRSIFFALSTAILADRLANE
jgi:membrane-bound lytic murein transglycosylase B